MCISDEAEKPTEIQPVAQVAPLMKNPEVRFLIFLYKLLVFQPEQPVARVGPVYQAQTEANVRRVAPTRPIVAAVPVSEPSPEPQPEIVEDAQPVSLFFIQTFLLDSLC